MTLNPTTQELKARLRREHEATYTPEFLALVEFLRPYAVHRALCGRGYVTTRENSPNAQEKMLGRFKYVQFDEPGAECAGVCKQDPREVRRGMEAYERVEELRETGAHLLAAR